jgi:hypothetical protein
MLNQTKYQILFFGMLVIIMRLLIRGTLAPPSLFDAIVGIATAAILYFVLFLLVEEWKSAPPQRKQLYAGVTGTLLLVRGFLNLYAGTFSVFNIIGMIAGTMFLIFYWKNRRKNILG